MRTIGLPAGVTPRPLTTDDAQAVVDLVGSCELADLGEVFIEIEDVWSDWERPGFDLTTESLGVEEDGRLVAVAEVFMGRRAEVNVHPDHQGRGIGGALLRWTWQQAAQHGSDRIGETVSDRNERAASLFRAHGYEVLYHSWVLELPPESAVPDSPLPPGVQVREFRVGQDERVVFQVIEDAFNEWRDRSPSTYDDWAPGVIGRGGFEPWQLLVATRPGAHGEEVVGASHLVMSGDEGWVNQIAVHREHRGQGVARALLSRSFGVAREHGATRFGLSTDSRTGALGLYERLGMKVRLSFSHWSRRM